MLGGEIVPLSSLVKAAGVSLRCLKRRLKKIDSRIGGGLLVRFGDAVEGRLYADKAMLRKHLPGYLRDPEDADPEAEMLREITSVRDTLRYVQDDVALIRDRVCADP